MLLPMYWRDSVTPKPNHGSWWNLLREAVVTGVGRKFPKRSCSAQATTRSDCQQDVVRPNIKSFMRPTTHFVVCLSCFLLDACRSRSLTELTRQNTPLPKIGHAPRPIEPRSTLLCLAGQFPCVECNTKRS